MFSPAEQRSCFTVRAFVLLAGAAVLSLLLGVSLGSHDIGGLRAAVDSLLSGQSSLERSILLQLRLPRALCAFAVGALLAVAGALMQVLLRNPLADPYVLGVSGGAAFAAMLAMLLGVSAVAVAGFAFGGALFSMLLVMAVTLRAGDWSPDRLLLTGVVVAAGWAAAMSFTLSVSPAVRIPGMLFWLMGDLSDAVRPLLPWAALIAGLAVALLIAPRLNVLARGELEAAALGVPVAALRYVLYVVASLLTAIAVSVAGSVGFLGLVVPHAARFLVGGDHRILLPGAALLGGTLLTVADTLARVLFAPRQLPVGVLTALLGVPAFLYLLHRKATLARPAASGRNKR